MPTAKKATAKKATAPKKTAPVAAVAAPVEDWRLRATSPGATKPQGSGEGFR